MADRAEARSRGDDAAKELLAAALSEGEIDAEIRKLAALPEGVYESSRKAALARLGEGWRGETLDRLVKAERKKRLGTKSAPPEFDPAELQRSAEPIIRHPDILGLFAKEFSKVIAGEAINGKLLYLIATSRLFDKPMHGAIKGTSAGGKSEIRKRALEFFPPPRVSSASPASAKRR
jgi:hypothetical protein